MMLSRVHFYNQQKEAQDTRFKNVQNDNQSLMERIASQNALIKKLQAENHAFVERMESQSDFIKSLQSENNSLNQKLRQIEKEFVAQQALLSKPYAVRNICFFFF